MSTTALIVPPLAAAEDGRVLEVLGADAEDHAAPDERSQRVATAHVEAVFAEDGGQRAVFFDDVGADEVHRRRADELATKRFSGRS